MLSGQRWLVVIVVAIVSVAAASLGASSAASATTAPTPACQAVAPPVTYQHVVVVVMENRTWSKVGGPGFGAMPYLASLAKHCAFYADWTETNRKQSSLTQYIGLTSGIDNPRTVNDCSPSATCSSRDDNIFRQVRQAGGTPRSYVEGASKPCSAAGNAAKHIPALYYRGSYQDARGRHDDATFCKTEVRPARELDPDHLPTFAFVTPTQCNDGHDCPNTTVDGWARVHIGALLDGADYRTGNTAVLVLYDEDFPVPNLLIAPSARSHSSST